MQNSLSVTLFILPFLLHAQTSKKTDDFTCLEILLKINSKAKADLTHFIIPTVGCAFYNLHQFANLSSHL